jgi:hypothetical protein
MKLSFLTTPPPPRAPSPKHPLFTTKILSTKSFGPGHVVGTGILVLGIVGLSKFFIARTEAARARKTSSVAQVDNARGQYGKE